MQLKNSISLPQKGMNKDSHSSQLQQQEYRLLVNGNSNSETGESFVVQNEPSNYYGVKFPDSYKVINATRVEDKTYFFLTSTITNDSSQHYKRSSIGYVLNNIVETYNQDEPNEDCTSCNNQRNTLDTSLEELIQTPSHQYTELVHDRCISLSDIEDKGLNFNINFPIKKVDVKKEKLGVVLYWEDDRNPSRYLQVSRIEEALDNNTFDYLHTIDTPCDDPQESDCLLVDKLLISPKYKRMKIEAEKEQIGGNLKKGTYEYWGAYCDVYGNVATEYCTPTNPVSIYDEYNNISTQTELDEFTNYAIKLKIRNLDIEHFKYYKIVAVERNNVANTQSAFLVGIFPTTDDIVVHTHSGSSNDDLYITRGNISIKKRVDFNELSAVKQVFEKAKTSMISDERRFIGGLTATEEINLQPVVNLFSSLVHWQTSASNENLYKSFVATSKYKHYNRNEVQPFAIRFLLNNGDYTSNFPFVGRPLLEGEDDIITEDINVQSVNFQGNSCATIERNKKWQIFNTASVYDDVCNSFDGGIELDPEDIQKSCIIENVAEVPTDTIVLNIDEKFSSLEDYINIHKDDICNVSSDYYNALLCGYLNNPYTSSTCSSADLFDESFCDTPVLVDTENIITNIVNEQVEKTLADEKSLSDYIKSIPPSLCAPYKKGLVGGNYTSIEDTNFTDVNKYTPCYVESIIPGFPPITVYGRKPVYFRDSTFKNENCNYATSIIDQFDPSQSGQSIFFNYDGSEVESNLHSINTSYTTSALSVYFKGNLHNKAQFFKIKTNNRKKFILEFTSQSGCLGEGDYFEEVGNTTIRYTIYEKCSTGATPLKTALVDLSNSSDLLQVIDTTLFPTANNATSYIVAVDCPIVRKEILTDCENPLTERDVYLIAPPCSCISIYTRDIEYNTVTVSWDSIIISKKMTYEATCTFKLPVVNGCDIIPYKKGRMAYWESTVEYSDNKELYNSSNLKIKPSDLTFLSNTDRNEFLTYYTNGLNLSGEYILKNADLRCQKIRHPKFPDNSIAPYMLDGNVVKSNSESIIFPLGINLDDQVVKAMISVAYNNNLITKKQRDSIVGWEILRGDNSIHKSIIANCIATDVYNYTEDGQTTHFSNFPYNDLGENNFLLNPQTNGLIQHPYSGNKNHLFTLFSPDLFLTKPTLPSEASLQGYLVGNSNTGFADVKNHPQWTVLGSESYTFAGVLAGAEVVLEALIKYIELQVQANQGLWFIAGFSTGSGAAGTGASTGLSITAGASLGLSAFFKYGEYRYKWLEIFRNLGRMDNLASMQYSNATYNKFLKSENPDNTLRRLTVKKYLKDNDYNIIDESNGQVINFNNSKREYSALISTGQDFAFNYDLEYKKIDNNKISPSTSSNFVNSQVNCDVNKGFIRDVASPLITLQNYIPDQWDTIDSVKWLSTNYIFDLDEDTSCTPIYGGTVVISRLSWRKKVPIFSDNYIGTADKLACKYSAYKNIGKPRFYCDYETADDAIFNYLSVFPDIKSDYNLDCEEGGNSFYVRKPSKFYLYVYSVVDFLVPSEINCNFRYGKLQPKDQFYNGQNLSEWLQEVNLPISEPNTFYYNNTYSLPVSNSPHKKLDRTYSKEIWNKRRFYKNAWIWSEKDNNENSLVDPYLIYKPFNFWEDKTNKGNLIDLRSIESNQFFARYEDKLQLYNQVNQYADSINNQNKEIGTGFLYSRPIEFKSTDLGFAGTQNTDFVSTPYGHFWADCKRGRIFQVDQNGGNMEIISETVQGRPTGMKNWFREHLPYKILKYLPEVDIDNKYKGLGMNMWWDDRFSRVFFTKRDYILQPGVNKNLFSYNKETKQLKYNNIEVFFDNSTLFKDVSWTISFKPTEGVWNSFFTFYPDYSVSQQNYFQSGYNWGESKETLWNHLLNNSSFGVFQGKFHPFILEFPVSNENVNKILSSLSIDVETRRYQNEWDYSVNPEIGITDLFVYNSKQNTGYLVLHPQRTLTDERKYPKVEGNKQHILTTFVDGKQNINYFFDRVLNDKANIPHLKKDENNIFSAIDDRIVKFSGKKVLERMMGSDFIVNISNQVNSQFQILIKNIINQEIIEP